MIPKKQNTKERKSKAGNKKKNIIVPLISVLMLICIICTIASGINLNNNNANKQIAEVEPNKEQISAETTTLNAGEEYVVPEDGLYRIELHGGKSSGYRGSKVTKEVVLHSGDRLETKNIPSYEPTLDWYVPTYINTNVIKAGKSFELYINSKKRAFVSGGKGETRLYKSWIYYEAR